MSNPSERVEDMGFDQILQRLREVVGKLEAGNLGLEESLRVYEEGVALARRGHVVLDSAEKRVEILTRDPRGSLAAVPFEVASEDEAAPDSKDSRDSKDGKDREGSEGSRR